MRLHLVTGEDPLTLRARAREWIRFPQVTMPLVAALTPGPWVVTHIFKRLNVSRTGLWWNIPRNLGYLRGLTGEVRARAELHQPGQRNPQGL